MLRFFSCALLHPQATFIFSTSFGNVYPLFKILYRLPIRLHIVYWVIRGTLAERISEGVYHPKYMKMISLFIMEGIKMKKRMADLGFNNVLYEPNFKTVGVLPQIRKADDGRIHFLFLSRIIPDKGCRYILQCASILNEKGLSDRYVVDFYGNIDNDGRLSSTVPREGRVKVPSLTRQPLTDIDRMIMESRYLNALEIESRAETPLSEMERQDFIDLLQSKDETIAQFKSMIASFEKVLDADAIERGNLLDQIAKLTAEVAKLNDYNQRHNKFSFGKKSLKSGSKPDNKPSREEGKDRYDGTPGSLSSESSNNEVPPQAPEGVDQSKVTSKPLDKKRGPRGPYTTMEVATTYYTLIETAKLNNLSPMDYLTHVFRQLMEGNKDYESLLPGKLVLQTI